MQVLVTRPAAQAPAWVSALRAAGLDAQALPLIEVAAAAPQWLERCWLRLAAGSAATPGAVAAPVPGDSVEPVGAVMFVSANAIEHFFASQPAQLQAGWQQGLRFWVTGPASRDALLAHGVEASRIDGPTASAAQWDSEALWAVVAPQVVPGLGVLIVRGTVQSGQDETGRGLQDAAATGVGRDWFAAQVQAAGGLVAYCVAYVRRPPTWSPEQRRLAQGQAVWLFTSSEAIGNLQTLLPLQSWAQARCVATHARIAQAAHAAGFGVVCLSRPGLEAVLASIKSLA